MAGENCFYGFAEGAPEPVVVELDSIERLVEADGRLWVFRSQGPIQALDPMTGPLALDGQDVDRLVLPTAVGSALWAVDDQYQSAGLARIDPATGTVDQIVDLAPELEPTFEPLTLVASAAGELWLFGERTSDPVLRIDPDTGQVVDTISLPETSPRVQSVDVVDDALLVRSGTSFSTIDAG